MTGKITKYTTQDQIDQLITGKYGVGTIAKAAAGHQCLIQVRNPLSATPVEADKADKDTLLSETTHYDYRYLLIEQGSTEAQIERQIARVKKGGNANYHYLVAKKNQRFLHDDKGDFYSIQNAVEDKDMSAVENKDMSKVDSVSQEPVAEGKSTEHDYISELYKLLNYQSVERAVGVLCHDSTTNVLAVEAKNDDESEDQEAAKYTSIELSKVLTQAIAKDKLPLLKKIIRDERNSIILTAAAVTTSLTGMVGTVSGGFFAIKQAWTNQALIGLFSKQMARVVNFTSKTASIVMTSIVSVLGIGAIIGFTAVLVKRANEHKALSATRLNRVLKAHDALAAIGIEEVEEANNQNDDNASASQKPTAE